MNRVRRWRCMTRARKSRARSKRFPWKHLEATPTKAMACPDCEMSVASCNVAYLVLSAKDRLLRARLEMLVACARCEMPLVSCSVRRTAYFVRGSFCSCAGRNVAYWESARGGGPRRRTDDYLQSFMAAKPVCVRENPPLNSSLTNSSLSVMRASVALSCLRLGPEKHNIWPGIIRNCRKVRSTRCSDVDDKILSRMGPNVAVLDQGAPPFSSLGSADK